MKIKPLKNEITKYLKIHQLAKSSRKPKNFMEQEINHPSLNVELLAPKQLKIYSFRLDQKYRAIFIVTDGEIEIVTVTNHYQ